MNYFRDIWTISKLRIKLLCSSKRLVGVFILFFLLTGLIMFSYEEEVYEKSSIPIGIVDLDNTSITKDIIDEINNSGLIRVINGTEEELFSKLNKNEIFSIFVYEKGFSQKLLSLDTDEIITDYYSSNNKLTKIISDVVLAGMIDEICYTYCYKSYYKNKRLYSNVYATEEYKEHMTDIYKNEDKTLSFRFNVLENKSIIDEEKLDTVLLYKEIIFTICMIISVVITMIIGNVLINDNVIRANDRFIISNMKPSAVIIGDFISMTFISFIFSLSIVFVQVYKFKISSIYGTLKFMLLILVFECTISMIYILIARWIEDYVSYQLIGSIAILIIGVCGALYILGFMINDNITTIAKYTPLGILVNGYKNLVMNVNINTNIIVLIIECSIIYMITYIKRWRFSL